MNTPDFRYRAFISYSHRDEAWAEWVHRALERYRVPKRLVARVTPAGVVPARLTPVFRDRDELPTATDLGRVVTVALEQAAALIVVCSPAAAQSRWVNEEIRAFKRTGRAERIFCLIVDGDPAGRDAEQCFPEALREASPDAAAAEPIAADARPGKDGRGPALLKIIAGLIGVGLDELIRREQHRRQRRLAAIAAAAVAGMAVTSVLATLALIARNDAVRQRSRAEVEAATAQQTTQFLVQLFEVTDPSEARGNSITAREILDRGAIRIDSGLTDQPRVRAVLMSTIGRVYTGLGLYAPASELLRRAQSAQREIASAPSDDSVRTANSLGSALYEKGDYAAATDVYNDALRAAQELHPQGDATVTAALAGIGDVLWKTGDYVGAAERYQKALEADRRLHGDVDPDVARDLDGLGLALMFQARYAESEAAFREALAIRRQTLGNDHPLVAQTVNNLGSLFYLSGQQANAASFFREAAELYEKILGHDHPFVSSIENNLGRVLLEQGDLVAAKDLLSDALAIDRELNPGNDDFVFTLNNLGLVELALGDVDSALPMFEEARNIAEPLHHRMLGQVLANLGDAYRQVGRRSDAQRSIDLARPLLADAYPDEPWHLANLGSIEGALRVSGSDLAGAEPLLVNGYAIVSARWGERGLFTRLAADRLATFYSARGDAVAAEKYRRISGR